MEHSYEEIRDVALDILSGQEQVPYKPTQYEHLKIGVAHVFATREGRANSGSGISPHLRGEDPLYFQEVFWDLFREGVITLGMDDSNRDFPWFRVSSAGKRFLEGQASFRFHDVDSYTKLVTDAVPNINADTLVYLKEAMLAFKSGCILSCAVMLGVATEHTFLLLQDVINGNPTHKAKYAGVGKERTILRKVNKFKRILDQDQSSLAPDVKEDLDTHFAGILSVIRTFRNEAGHPSGKTIDREQAYVLLQLFGSYCKKMYQLMAHFS